MGTKKKGIHSKNLLLTLFVRNRSETVGEVLFLIEFRVFITYFNGLSLFFPGNSPASMKTIAQQIAFDAILICFIEAWIRGQCANSDSNPRI